MSRRLSRLENAVLARMRGEVPPVQREIPIVAAVRGAQHYNAKLVDDDVRLIRALVEERRRLLAEAARLSDVEIGRKFGVHANTIWKIASWGSWVHVNTGSRR